MSKIDSIMINQVYQALDSVNDDSSAVVGQPLLPDHLSILYQDECLVAVNKPANIFVHRTYLNRHEKQVMLQWVRDQIGAYVYPVHRLDRATSGVLLFALNEQAAHQLCLDFERHRIEKEYYALSRGFAPASGAIDKPLKEKLDKIADKHCQTDKPAQLAFTNYRTVTSASLPYAVGKFDSVRYSLIHLQPTTGRRHQLRRHLSSIAHPIIGDVRYGDNTQNHFFANHMGFKRLMLHASQLSFTHPSNHKTIKIEAPFDENWSKALTIFDECQLNNENNTLFANLSKLSEPC